MYFWFGILDVIFDVGFIMCDVDVDVDIDDDLERTMI